MSYSNYLCREEFTFEQGQRMRNLLAIAENDNPLATWPDISLALQTLEIKHCIVKETIESSVTTNTIWSASTFQSSVKEVEGIVEIAPGARLTIESDLEVRFPKGSVLRVMPGGTLVLKGKLTNNSCVNACNNTGFGTCGDTWKGVEVWGNSLEHQFTVCDQDENGTINDFRKQGRFIGKPGSIIENAEVAVQLWGPDVSENSGGIIQCTETTFRNNIVGIDFRPYQNFFPIDNTEDPDNCDEYPVSQAGKRAKYFGSLAGCTFVNDNDYPHNTNFEKFIYMEGVDGPTIRGCSFDNGATPLSINDIYSYGYGIHSIDSEFTLEERCNTSQIPCNQITRSEFTGLGVGVKVGGYPSSIKRFKIKQADFTDCFVGIHNRAASNGEIIFNDFHMGNMPPLWSTQTQIGIQLNGNITQIALQENEFVREFNNPNIRTIGISTTNVGANDLSIRKNYFDGLNIGNEAGGNCGTSSSDVFNSSGLKFECNDNNDNVEYDFLICNTFGVDRINPNQGVYIGSQTGFSEYISSGNKFSNSGSNPDRDFSNQGNDLGMRYYFYNVLDQNPNETSGITSSNKIFSNSNECELNFCEIPCKTEGELMGLKNSFFGKQTSFQQAIASYENAVNIQGENSKPARKFLARAKRYKKDMTRLADVVLRHTAADNQIGKRDSIRTWLNYKTTFGSELTLSFDFLKTNEHSVGLSKLNNLSNKFDLDSDQEMDQSQSLELYGILAAEPSSGFTKEQLSGLETIANSSTTFASGYAKNVLEKYNIKFPIEDCEHWSGKEENIDTRGSDNNNDQNIIQQLVLNVYPNPAKNQVNFEWDSDEGNTQLRISDLNGKVIFEKMFIDRQSRQVWNTFNIPSGIYFYEFYSEKSLTNRGRIVVQK